MWECEYSVEPMDYRLFLLRLVRKLWVLVAAALVGAVVIGGGYYAYHMLPGGGRTYQTESICYLDFAEDGAGEPYEFFNYYTWNEVIHTDFFMHAVCEQTGGKLTADQAACYTAATIDSDVRYLYIRCTTPDPELSLRMAKVLEQCIAEFGDAQKEFRSITVVKAAAEAKDNSNIRTSNAVILGGFIGFFTALFAMLALMTADTSVYLPATLERRFHLVTLGARSMKEFAANCQYLLRDAETVALIPSDDSPIPGESVLNCGKKEIVFAPITREDAYDKIRACDAVVLSVRAGAHNGRQTQRTIEQLARQGISVTAAVLVEEDERLLRAYYRK